MKVNTELLEPGRQIDYEAKLLASSYNICCQDHSQRLSGWTTAQLQQRIPSIASGLQVKL